MKQPSLAHAFLIRTGDRLIRLPEVCYRTALAKATIYKKVKALDFPAPVHLGRRFSAWYESEIDAWIAARRGAGA